jgi:hypothetical protein
VTSTADAIADTRPASTPRPLVRNQELTGLCKKRDPVSGLCDMPVAQGTFFHAGTPRLNAARGTFARIPRLAQEAH